jgi:hypothetical protein
MTAMKTLLAVVMIAGVVVCSTVASADDNGKFNNKSLKGAYGFFVQGFLAANTPNPIPASAMGRNVYDGAGSCTSDAKLNAGGTVIPLIGTCTYTVNPDGTGTATSTYSFGVFTTDFVLVDNAKEFHFIVSDAAQPGTTVGSGIAKRQK